MCLHYSTTVPTHQGERTVWKVLKRIGKELLSIYILHLWKLGENQSNRYLTTLDSIEISDGEINKGFHVYTNKNEAERAIRGGRFLVEMTVDSDDFVAEDTFNGEAVYIRATISEEEYERVIGHG